MLGSPSVDMCVHFSHAHSSDWGSWVVGDRGDRFEALPGFPGTAPFRSPTRGWGALISPHPLFLSPAI